MERTTLAIHFEDRSGNEFERLTFAFVSRQRNWDSIEWIGQTGGDGGRDILGQFDKESYCYQCANYRSLTFKKAKEDIDKLVKHITIPDNFILVCGGRVTADIRKKVIEYAKSVSIKTATVWTGVEFEEFIRKDTPELIKRFVEGERFPDTAFELIKFATIINAKNDNDIVDLIAECFDRPAFTTMFYRESNIPDFEKAIKDTIEVLNTGVHRLRDGTIIRTIPSRHRISDEELKKELAIITKLIVKLRDNFIELKRKKEIKPCGCNQPDCPVYMLSDNACRVMDNSRQEIFAKFKKIKPEFNLELD
jgi:hypothetical protein